MSTNKICNVLISVIGRGQLRKDQTIGYEQTEYVFNINKKESERYTASKTAFFGIALYEYLANKEKIKVDKFIIIGTDKSAWSELYQVLPEDAQNMEEVTEKFLKVYEAEKSGISEEMLSEWQDFLRKYLPGLKLYKIYPLDLDSGIDIILNELEENKEYNVIFDITHAFRNIPIAFSYGIMLLKYLRKINNVRMFYGARDMTQYFPQLSNSQSPVVEVSFVDKIAKMIEAMAAFENSGYFVPVLSQLGLGDREKTYFKIETNRPLRKEIDEIVEALEGKLDTCGRAYEREIIEIMKNEFSDMSEQRKLFQRMYKRAQFFYERKQYLKALILLYEATIVLFADVYNIKDNMNYNSREKARKKLIGEIKNAEKTPELNKLIEDQHDGKILQQLEYVRNAAVHGSSPQGNQNYLEQINSFKELFDSALKVFEKMLRRYESLTKS